MKKTLFIILLIIVASCSSSDKGLQYSSTSQGHNNRQKDLYPKINLKVVNKENKIFYGENNIVIVSGKQIDLKHVRLTASTGILVKIKEGWIFKTNDKTNDVVRFTASGISSFGRTVSSKFDFKNLGVA